MQTVYLGSTLHPRKPLLTPVLVTEGGALSAERRGPSHSVRAATCHATQDGGKQIGQADLYFLPLDLLDFTLRDTFIHVVTRTP